MPLSLKFFKQQQHLEGQKFFSILKLRLPKNFSSKEHHYQLFILFDGAFLRWFPKLSNVGKHDNGRKKKKSGGSTLSISKSYWITYLSSTIKTDQTNRRKGSTHNPRTKPLTTLLLSYGSQLKPSTLVHRPVYGTNECVQKTHKKERRI